MSLRYRLRDKASRLGLIPIIVFPFLIALSIITDPNGIIVFNPPNLIFIINAIFVFGTGVIVAIVSAIGYLRNQQDNILLLGSAVLIGGLASLIGGWSANISANYGVTIHNVAMFVSSGLQLLSALIAIRYVRFESSKGGRGTLAIVYLGVMLFMVMLTALTFVNALPVFFTSSGPTLVRQLVLGTDALFFALSALVFFRESNTSKSTGLYWYSLALSLFAIGMLGIIFQIRNADAASWVGRMAQYIGGIYFIIALLSIRKEVEKGSTFTQRWADTFKTDHRQYAALFSNMLNSFLYGKVITDKNGRPIDWFYLDVNDSFERLSGVKKEEIIGRKVTEVFPNERTDPIDWIDKLGDVALNGKAIQFEGYRQSFGKWLSVSAYSPRKGYFVAIYEDITERKKAEEKLRLSEQEKNNYLESMTDGFVALDKNWRYTYVNSNAARILHKSKEELIGNVAIDAFPKGSKFLEKFKEAILSGCPVHFDEYYPQPLDMWYECHCYPTNDGLTVFFSNVTERKKAEEALKEQNEKLQQIQEKLEDNACILEEYANQMEQLAEQRAKQLQDKERLAAIGATAGMVGHDIRNPLQAITGDLYLAREELKEMPDVKGKESMQEILDEVENNVFYINKIVNDLQDYARPILPEYRDIDLYKLVTDILQHSKIPKEISLTVDVDPSLFFKSDDTLLRRILTNLVINAVQAMPDGGKLEISSCLRNKTVLIVVEDTGVGIPEEVKPKLFTPMLTTKSKGQGFGLAVVKRLVEGLGGTVGFESDLGKGTKFVIELPTNKQK